MSFRTQISRLWLVLLFMTASSVAKPPSRLQHKVPGVGFSLTPDHGTAAIYFANGSSVDVARIEGSATYKSFMRKHAEGQSIAEDASGFSMLRHALCPLLQPLGFGVCQRCPDFNSAQSLLRSLQSSVASYLGTRFCFAGIVVPDRTWQYQSSVIDNAIQSIGLRQTHRVLDASRMVLVANNIDSSGTPGDKSQAVLSVDYSASGLNAVLIAEDAGIADVLRRVYDQRHGANSRGQPGHLNAVKAILTEVTKPPFGRDFSASPITDEVRRVVLYGDAVTNPDFLNTLKAVVGPDLVNEAHAFDPVYAAAIGMAKSSYERMDDVDFDEKPAFGCYWKSSLYDASIEEL